MPIGSTEKQNNADALRMWEEKRKDAKRKELEKEIESLNSIFTDVNNQIDDLKLEESNLITYLREWTAKKSLYNDNTSLSEVVVANVFEGVCADQIKSELTECITEMNHTCSAIVGLKGNVTSQISRLNQQRSSINARLSALGKEKDSL